MVGAQPGRAVPGTERPPIAWGSEVVMGVPGGELRTPITDLTTGAGFLPAKGAVGQRERPTPVGKGPAH